MNDLLTIGRQNEEAVIREYNRKVDRLHELEASLGITPTHAPAWALLAERIPMLEALTGSRIDPHDPELQMAPIYLGEWLAARQANLSSQSPFLFAQ